MISKPTLAPPAEKRQHLREAIARLSTAIANGECTPLEAELDALIHLCEKHFLPTEADKVRRWMTP